MSYCRWSSNDFQCDVYVYESVNDTWTIHVAGNRIVYTDRLPDPVPFDQDHLEEWSARYRKVMHMVELAERVPIGLPHDGETFECETPGEAADTLQKLLDLGYWVPTEVIKELREEEAS
jgi:hypothetical protein